MYPPHDPAADMANAQTVREAIDVGLRQLAAGEASSTKKRSKRSASG
jgi:hypothetical protein